MSGVAVPSTGQQSGVGLTMWQSSGGLLTLPSEGPTPGDSASVDLGSGPGIYVF